MSIKQMIDEYLTEWEDKCNVKKGAVNFGDLTFEDYCHTTDTIEVGISIKENRNCKCATQDACGQCRANTRVCITE